MLNMLHTSKANTTILAYEDLYDVFDFNHTPLAPFRKKGLVFVNPTKCTLFRPQTLDVFVVGRAPLHYVLLTQFVSQTPECT